MKKFTLAILLFVYSLSSFGVGVKQFYCCGKLKSTSLSFVQADKEKCSKDNSMEGCCKTSFKSLKVKDIHIASDGIQNPSKSFTLMLLYTPSYLLAPLLNDPMVVANTSHAPPTLHGVSINILHCVYRI